MLNYQEESCELSLKEGIEEYRKYLKTNNRHVLGENCSEDEKLAILGHDATHVIFGLDTSLEEVGKQFDVTRERIRQIEAKALRKLRHPSRSGHLKTFLDE